LVDGGLSRTYIHKKRPQILKKLLEKIKEANQRIDLLVLSHVDEDHIAGLLAGFKLGELLEELTDKVWFNSGKLIFEHFNQTPDETNLVDLGSNLTGTDVDNQTSIGQGVKFEVFITAKGIWDHELIVAGQVHELFGIKFTMLSPNEDKLRKLLVKWEREKPDSLTSSTDTDYDSSFAALLENDQFENDTSIHNGSSIAFIFEYEDKRLLLTGDAHDEVIVENVRKLGFNENNPLLLDYVKLSHHGSKYNTSPEFLSIINCQHFIISTNANRHGLPNKRTLARIVAQFPNANLLFNYPDIIKKKIFTDDELIELRQAGVTLAGCEQPFVL
jgi:beta-lactamase superfamily II metal-dependent hydrolase